MSQYSASIGSEPPHRRRSVAHHTFCDTAQENTGETRAAMRPHDDQFYLADVSAAQGKAFIKDLHIVSILSTLYCASYNSLEAWTIWV